MKTSENIEAIDAPQQRTPRSHPVSQDSLEAARDIEETSGRRVDTPVRKAFVRLDGSRSPLARVYVGGRSNVVAVKLYLALIWRCSTRPWSTDKPARFWATLLDLPDPEGDGARRVQNALQKLADFHLIELTPQPGSPSIVTLLDEHGDGTPYTLPSTAYAAAVSRKRKKAELEQHVYFKIPSKLWTKGRIQKLSGPALVMLLILLAEQAGEGKPVWFATKVFPERYHISHKTRAEGTAELQRRQLLRVDRQSLPDYPGGRSFERTRWRNVYYLTRKGQLVDETPEEEAKARLAAMLAAFGGGEIDREDLPLPLRPSLATKP